MELARQAANEINLILADDKLSKYVQEIYDSYMRLKIATLGYIQGKESEFEKINNFQNKLSKKRYRYE